MFAAVGEKSIITSFKTIGAEIFPCCDVYKLRATIKKLCEDNYTLILVTEKEYSQLVIPQGVYPIILPIPNGVEQLNIGEQRIKDFKHKSIGVTE